MPRPAQLTPRRTAGRTAAGSRTARPLAGCDLEVRRGVRGGWPTTVRSCFRSCSCRTGQVWRATRVALRTAAPAVLRRDLRVLERRRDLARLLVDGALPASLTRTPERVFGDEIQRYQRVNGFLPLHHSADGRRDTPRLLVHPRDRALYLHPADLRRFRAWRRRRRERQRLGHPGRERIPLTALLGSRSAAQSTPAGRSPPPGSATDPSAASRSR